MTDLLSDPAAVWLQFRLWGYAVTGDACEKSAVIAEGKHVESIVPGAWDRRADHLANQWVAYGDEDYHHPPEWWCLPWVTEFVLRAADDPKVQFLRPLGAAT